MTRFCTRCGAANTDDARFCARCGAPMRPVPPASALAAPARPAVAATPRRGWGVWLLAAVMALLLVLAGGLAWWVFGYHPGPTQAQADAAAAAWLQQHQNRLQQTACVRNFNYALDPVVVNGYDQNTRQWLDALVRVGVYTGPQVIHRGFFQQLQYRHGPEAARYIRDGALCVAQGLTVGRVQLLGADSAALRERLPGAAKLPAGWAVAAVQLQWRGLAPWAAQPPFDAQFTQLQSALRQTIVLHQDGQGWRLATPAEELGLNMQLGAEAAGAGVDQAARQLGQMLNRAAQAFGGASAAMPQPAPQQPGVLDWLRNLFSFGDPAAKLPREFFTAVAQGQMQQALALLGPDLQIFGADKLRLALQNMQQQMQARGGLKDVEVRSVSDLSGNRQVVYVLDFGNGSQERGTLVAGQVGGQWRILEFKGGGMTP